MPYHPKRWLRVQPSGVQEGALVFVVGYPGRTQRHQTYAEVKETTEWTFPRFVRTAQEQIDILEPLGRSDPELAIKAASRLRYLENFLTNRKGMLEGLVKGGVLATKQRDEQGLAAWIAADPGRRAEYGDVLPALRGASGRGGEDARAGRRVRQPGERLHHARGRPDGTPAGGREGEAERPGSRDGVPAAQLGADP